MTIEEAKREILKEAPDLGDTLSNTTVLKLLDKINEDLQSRVCKNCRFDYCGCSVQDSIINTAEILPNLDYFGCKSFERKLK